MTHYFEAKKESNGKLHLQNKAAMQLDKTPLWCDGMWH